MGHGSNDKLYITHTEHSGRWGQHTAGSSGYIAKQEAPRLALTPFDCCSLSLQPFEHPVCARNEDGTGTVFDLVNIIPWLKQHDNKHPITGVKLDPASLITLHYTRDGKGEYHDPVSFKRFSEHSHIVAVATTGNVFLAESVKGGRDLVADVDFSKKKDLITLQDPHGLPTAPPKPDAAKDKKAVAATTAVVPQKKAPLPWNASPYSTGMPGASLTSTSVDPHTGSSTALYDEEELMFDAIANPPKGKGKEKDVGKRRAYVRVVTTLGGGSLNLELYCEKAPKTCYNFLMLARQGKFEDCPFHRLIPGFMIQTGDPTGTGSGGESYWGTPFRDEFDNKNAAKHDSRGVLAMANRGPGTNGSQWYITFREAPNLDGKHTVFGKLVGGDDILDALEKLPRKDGTERPAKTVKIKEVVIYFDPFDEYKQRLARKLAHRAEAGKTDAADVEKKKDVGINDGVNWFGERLGSGEDVLGGKKLGGVGKYLDLKRPREESKPTSSVAAKGTEIGQEAKKRKKLGFGDFDGW
ncbi:hypothetical protein M422DRAFT_216413 [Sphaerobolus stellatus SS14]|uniref:RING-type E3 ubiquitin transferase n=1 Tax=Sphaerobolus stellatus (strain SS14) TaxID=990650 RepID=A0A0C9TAK2_SPHS4|nr:hypothetical protein M422DRAFT_216413 [Sphaerobolus stellatus SS14]